MAALSWTMLLKIDDLGGTPILGNHYMLYISMVLEYLNLHDWVILGHGVGVGQF